MKSPPRHLLVKRPAPALLSIVIPVYNEERVFGMLRARMEAFISSLPGRAELLLVNDGSSDGTLELLMQWAEADPRVKVVGLARNFGHQVAVTAGLDVAAGDAIVVMDADLQDPPELIHEMVAKYCEGYDVVYGQRSAREGEPLVRRAAMWTFYRLMRLLAQADLPPDTGDFRLVSKRCLDALRAMRETHRFLRGMVVWVGFAQTAIQYRRPARAAGESKYPFHKLVRLAVTGAVSFSAFPLRLSLGLGVAVAGVGAGVGIYALASRLLGWNVVPGWTTVVVLLCLIGGAVLVSNGILGEYVGRVFEESKGRPLYVVSSVANLPAAALGASTLAPLQSPAPVEAPPACEPARADDGHSDAVAVAVAPWVRAAADAPGSPADEREAVPVQASI